MEQRNFSEQNDIRPIEELFGSNRPAPDVYSSGYKHYEPAKPAQPRMSQQPAAPKNVDQPFIPENFAVEPKKKKKTEKRSKFNGISHRSPFLWALLGFAVGVTFWHFVGFWSFVEGTVLQKPDRTQTELSASVLRHQNRAFRSGQNRATPVAPVVNLKSCVTLVLNRRRKVTFAIPCKSGETFRKGRASVLRTAARINR